MSDVSFAAGRSPLEVGVLITLVTLGLAGLFGFIAVIDANDVTTGFGTGLGVALLIFLAGGTIASAIACLKRARAELVALASIVVTGVAIDMFVLAIWLDINNEAYGKVAGIAFTWGFFALVVLALMLAVGTPTGLAWSLYLGALVAAIVAALVSTWLIATAGGGDVVSGSAPGDSGFPIVGLAPGDDELLRLLGGSLVLLAAFWFGALAASRLERPHT